MSKAFTREFIGTILLPTGWLKLADLDEQGEVQADDLPEGVGAGDFHLRLQAGFKNIRVPVYATLSEDGHVLSIEIDMSPEE